VLKANAFKETAKHFTVLLLENIRKNKVQLLYVV